MAIRKVLLKIFALFSLILFSSNSYAQLTYDLRFITDQSHPDAKVRSLTAADVGTPVTLQLWGVISKGSDGLFGGNDAITSGFVNIYGTNSAGAGAMVAGSGITGAAFPNTAGFSISASRPGSGGNLRLDTDHDINTAPVTTDGILDWGADQAYSTIGLAANSQNLYTQNGVVTSEVHSYLYSFGGNTPIVAGTPATGSQVGTFDSTKWEVLLGEFTVSINGLTAGGTTSFDPYVYHRMRMPDGSSVVGGMVYNLDGINQNTAVIDANQFSGVQFIAVPEPSTYFLILALVVSATVYRFRRFAGLKPLLANSTLKF